MYMFATQGVDFIHCKYLINHVCGTPACDDIVVCSDKLDAIMIKVLICLAYVSASALHTCPLCVQRHTRCRYMRVCEHGGWSVKRELARMAVCFTCLSCVSSVCVRARGSKSWSVKRAHAGHILSFQTTALVSLSLCLSLCLSVCLSLSLA